MKIFSMIMTVRSETEKYKDILNPNDIVACKRICGYLLAAFEKRSTALHVQNMLLLQVCTCISYRISIEVISVVSL